MNKKNICKDKLFINGRFFTQKTTGVQRYAMEITKELDKLLLCECDLVIPSDSNIDIKFSKLKVVVLKGKGNYFWEQVLLPRFINKQNGVLLNFCNLAPFFCKRTFVTIHDVAFYDTPHAFPLLVRFFYKLNTKICAKKSLHVFTVSDFSKRRIIERLGVSKEKITVVTSGVHESFANSNTMPDFINDVIIKRGFYFSLGSSNKNKNLPYIIQAAQNNPEKFFLISGDSNKLFKKKKKRNLPGNLVITGYLNDSQISWLYKNCDAFLFPSLYEGFGLPPLEAISCGCQKIILSDIPPFHEIYADSANFVSPYFYDKKEFLNCCKQIDNSVKTSILNRYSWAVSASVIYQIIKEETCCENIVG